MKAHTLKGGFKSMKLKIKRFTMVLLLTFTLAFTSMGLASAEEIKPDKITIVHTNDMHGRLNQKDKVLDAKGKDTDIAVVGTRLARLKSYTTALNPTLVLDAGDSIQGLPISNINKGDYMIDAMLEVGYDAMTLGNHEFDFGYDQTQAIKAKLENTSMRFMSSNVFKNNELGFKPYDIIEKDGLKIAVIAFTTPETITKTHPNNIVGVTFKSPTEQADFYIKEVMGSNDIDVLVLLGHLGLDGETKDDWRGDKLAEYISKQDLKVPTLVVDGHSHTPVDGGEMFGDNVLYVQTGEYLNNIGHVELDLKDFSKSTAKLVKIRSVELKAGEADVLVAETAAKADYEVIAGEELISDFKYFLNGERDLVRTRETNLGNVIGDAMVAYGKSLLEKPDFAVMNGGGIRANINPGKITKGDAISVIPFGNMYSSVEATGAQVIEMFEFSLRTPIDKDKVSGELLKDELGHYILGSNGGFLQVSSTVRVTYNVLAEPGSRVQKVEVDRLNGWEEVTPEGKYIVATNDFLAQGGDGYKMLGGKRTEGASLDDVFAMYLNSSNVDWSVYETVYNPTRVLQVAEALEEEVAPEVTPEVKPEVKPELTPKPETKPDKVLPNVGVDSNTLAYGSLLIASGMTSLGFMKFKRKED